MRFLVFIFAVVACAIMLPAANAEEYYSDDFRNSVNTEESLLPDDIDLNDPQTLQGEITPDKFLGFIADQIKNSVPNALRTLIIGLSMVMLSVLVARCNSNLQSQNFQYLFTFITSISMVMICQEGLTSCASALQKAAGDMGVFTAACIPSFTVVMMSAGEGGGASVFSASMVLLGEIGTLLTEQIMLPLIEVYLSIGICAVISDEYNFSSIAKQIRRFVIWFIGIAIAGFKMILKLQSGIASAGDRLTQKTIRTAVGGMIPMVGNTLSQGVDGLFTVAAGVKVSFAVAAVLIILSIMIPVLIEILIYGVSWSVVRWVAEFMNDSSVRSISDVMANGFYMMLAIGGFITLMGLLSFFGIMVQVS